MWLALSDGVDLYVSTTAPHRIPCGQLSSPCYSLSDVWPNLLESKERNATVWFDAEAVSPVYAVNGLLVSKHSIIRALTFRSWTRSTRRAVLDFGTGIRSHNRIVHDVEAGYVAQIVYTQLVVTNSSQPNSAIQLFVRRGGAANITFSWCAFARHEERIIFVRALSPATLAVQDCVFATNSLPENAKPLALVALLGDSLSQNDFVDVAVRNCHFERIMISPQTTSELYAVLVGSVSATGTARARVFMSNCSFVNSNSLFVRVTTAWDLAVIKACRFADVTLPRIQVPLIAIQNTTTTVIEDTVFVRVLGGHSSTILLLTATASLIARSVQANLTRLSFFNCSGNNLLRWNLQRGTLSVSEFVAKYNQLQGASVFLFPASDALLKSPDPAGYPRFQYQFFGTVLNSSIISNTGSALFAAGGDITIANSTFVDNVADNGGALLLDSTVKLVCDHCYIVNNSARISGTALLSTSSAPLLILRSRVLLAKDSAVSGALNGSVVSPSGMEVDQGGQFSVDEQGTTCCFPGHRMEAFAPTRSTSRNCPLDWLSSGKMCTASTLSVSCRACPAGTYSMLQTCMNGQRIVRQVDCRQCPLGAKCLGADSVRAEPGFWGPRVHACHLPLAGFSFVLAGSDVADDAVSGRILRGRSHASGLLRVGSRRQTMRCLFARQKPDLVFICLHS